MSKVRRVSWSPRQMKKRLKSLFCQLFIYGLLGIFALTLLLRVAPVPFSAYMAQQVIGDWLQSEKDYELRYQWVSLEEIAWPMQLAVIAAEDQRFVEHAGVDWAAIKSAVKNNKNTKRLRGGSTISQQTVKNLYLWHGQSWLRKAIELPLTFLVEMLWSKQRILEVYLNIAEFGEGVFGVEAASQYYFNKPAAKLNQQEAALLAAVLPNPIIYQVKKPSAYVRHKQTWILRQMRQLGGKNYLNQL
ncbi:monofunctional biosynthetic peptidoglycan transglycosylase [Conservatibacter flavescens]|uniref:Biosynthetic peptidoglycan transglycosylase n=1 Tax=Conservatibacter flavescens TaxID=28161 RepID=A0A2M8S1M3_9PAST|nr:monofunctional biosynthetic peptidoglycan transglycosylase [Conservatibacter flavescens]PJG85018.1 monofunctional biosynthetic peptidoglycan transglycosylase [Conservatibacter flavescens]